MIGKVEALCIQTKEAKFPTGTIALAEVSLEGFVGDVHGGFVRKADSRDKPIPRGTPVRNWRQWSAISIEELEEIARTMGIERIEPWMLAANITVSGVANFTQLPRGTHLHFDGGTILTVECENAPCVQPGQEIEKVYKEKKPQEFVKAAIHKRGLVGVVYHPGTIRIGEMVKIVLPP